MSSSSTSSGRGSQAAKNRRRRSRSRDRRRDDNVDKRREYSLDRSKRRSRSKSPESSSESPRKRPGTSERRRSRSRSPESRGERDNRRRERSRSRTPEKRARKEDELIFIWDDFDYETYNRREEWNDDIAFFERNGLSRDILEGNRRNAITEITRVDRRIHKELLFRWNRYKASQLETQGQFNQIEITERDLINFQRRQAAIQPRRIQDIQYRFLAPINGVFALSGDTHSNENVGRLRWTENNGRMEITEVFTRPEWRGQGNARNMIRDSILYAREREMREIVLQSDAQSGRPEDQEALRRLYSGFGFENTGTGNWMRLSLR